MTADDAGEQDGRAARDERDGTAHRHQPPVAVPAEVAVPGKRGHLAVGVVGDRGTPPHPLDRAGKTSYHVGVRNRGARTIATSKLTSKAQTVVPRAIRERLGLRPGDVVRYRATKVGVVIDKRPETEDDPFVEFVEWASAEDEASFKDL